MEKEKNGNIESVNNSKYKLDLKDQFLKEFNNNILSSENKNDYLDDIINKDSISDSTLLDHKLKEVQAYNDKFKDFDLSKINIFDLRRGVAKEAMKLENARKNYLEYTFSHYDLSEKQKDKLEKEIQKLKESELEKLIFSEEKNDYFLKKIFKETINKPVKLTFLDNLTTKDIEKRLAKYSPEQRKEINIILNNLKSGRVYDTDIRDLFSFDFFTPSEKKQLIETFIPYISLAKAVELGLLDKSEALAKKEKILKPVLINKKIDSSQIDDIIEKASLSDIRLKSKDLLKNESDFNNVAENIGFANLENSFNTFVEEEKKKIEKAGPKNFKDLKIQLQDAETEGKIENLGDFENKAVIRQVYKDESGNEKVSYLRIESIDDTNKKISLKPLGDNSSGEEIVNFKSHAKNQDLSFVSFLEVIRKSDKISFFKESDLEKKIESGEINAVNSQLDFYTKDELQNAEIRKELEEKYKGNLEKQLKALELEKDEVESEIEELEKKIESEKDKKLKENLKEKIEILNTQKENLEIRIKEKKKEIDELENSSLSTNKFLEIGNKQKLLEKLDEIDPDGKDLGLEKGMYLETKDGIYEVTGIDWESGEINLYSIGKGGVSQPETLNLESFYESFKKNKATRIEKFNNVERFLEENQKNSSKKEIWNKYEIRNGELHLKKSELEEYSLDKNTKTEYLRSGDELIKINKIAGDKIIVSFGEYKSAKKIEKEIESGISKKNKYKSKTIKDNGQTKTIFSPVIALNKKEYTYTLNEFNKIINKEKEEYVPDNSIGKIETKSNPQEENDAFHRSASTKFFNGLAITDLIFGAKFMVEGVEEYFKKGTELRGARFGLGLGKVLPDEVKQDLLAKVEAHEKDAMDKEIESLGKIDSWVATERIEKWILNKNTAEYKKEAGMMFMLKKYGHLTAKSGLSKYSGKFIWYQALGGRIGDEFFLEIKREANKDNKTFSEEFLVYKFLKKQCSGTGFNGIKRRTRLHKEYKALWPQGVEDEMKTGYEDASDERTARAMVDGGIGEMEGGTISNGVGWFKKAIERGGSLEDMSEGFFTLLYSGAIYSLDQKVYLKIKALWDGEQMPMIMARFSSFKDDMVLFNKTVLELSKRIGQEYPDKFPGITNEAQELFNDALLGKGEQKERIQRAQKFWQKYGTPLSRALNMNHHGDTTYAKTDKILILEKNKNPIFKEYYEKTRSFATEGTFKKDFMEDAMGMEGVGGLNTEQVTKQFLQMTQGGSLREGKAGSLVWKNIVKDIEAIKKSDLSLSDKQAYIKHTLRDVIAGFLANHGGNKTALGAYNNKTNNIGQTLNKWNLHIYNDFGDVSETIVMDENNKDINNRLDRVVNNILSGGIENTDELYENGFEELIDTIKEKAANNLNYEGMNE